MVVPLPSFSPTKYHNQIENILKKKMKKKTTELAEKRNHYLNAVIELILSP